MKDQRGFGLVGVLIIIVAAAVLGGAGWYVWQNQAKEGTPSSANQTQERSADNSQASDEQPLDEQYQLKGELRDVTMAKTVRGIQTNGQSGGEAKARFANGKYELLASFDNLPDPQDDDFYEGWIVRRTPFKFISTGKLVKVNDAYTNTFTSEEDLTPFDLYVLTLEPNDGDPAPADHIVEGVMAP